MTDIYKTFKPTTETHFPLKCTQSNLQDRVDTLKTENIPGFYLHHSGTELEINKQKKNSQKNEISAPNAPLCQRRNHRGNQKYVKQTTKKAQNTTTYATWRQRCYQDAHSCICYLQTEGRSLSCEQLENRTN